MTTTPTSSTNGPVPSAPRDIELRAVESAKEHLKRLTKLDESLVAERKRIAEIEHETGPLRGLARMANAKDGTKSIGTHTQMGFVSQKLHRLALRLG